MTARIAKPPPGFLDSGLKIMSNGDVLRESHPEYIPDFVARLLGLIRDSSWNVVWRLFWTYFGTKGD